MKYKLEIQANEIEENQPIKKEVNQHEILLTKIEGKIYAVGDRCGHMGVSLSEGELTKGIVKCPMHKAEFDVRTGKNTKKPKIPKMLSPTKMGKLMSEVKTHNLPTYPISKEGNDLYIEI